MKQENIFYFSPNSYLNTNTHAAQPSEVIGFLEDNSCFIATAAYGSPMAKETLLFKKFRDLYLKKSSLGRLFIKSYYNYSPSIAKWIKQKEKRKKWIRFFLWPLLTWVKGCLFLGLWGTLILTICPCMVCSSFFITHQKNSLFYFFIYFTDLCRACPAHGRHKFLS